MSRNYKFRWLKNSSSPQFSYQLKYEDGTTPQYNGNIANQSWGAGSTFSNTFTYSYDKLNRLTNGTATGMSESLNYDKMGNITSLTRDGLTPNTYSYDGNKLTGITGNLNTGTYQYDANGNAIFDGRNNATLTYNVLNLPNTVSLSSGNMTYTYDATGNKLKKQSTLLNETRDYIGGIEYKNGNIELIHTEEGIARRSGSSYSYEYNLKDHLGNVRYTFYKNPSTGLLERLQSDDYYPFGLRKSNPPISLENKYLYNDKELQEELNQYDYGARFYDPVIGRWNVIDPLGENHFDFTPYNYTLNNPLKYIDPFGLDTIPVNKVDPKTFNPTNDVVKLDEVVVTASKQDNGDNPMVKAAQTTLGFMAADIAVLEPTDAAWPKWVAYAVAGAASGAIIYSAGEGNKNYPGPWNYTYRPPSLDPINNPPNGPNPEKPEENGNYNKALKWFFAGMFLYQGYDEIISYINRPAPKSIPKEKKPVIKSTIKK